MAMLAEPRRKQKIINLRAKNNAWSNDSTKFGQRMLEKMGWSSGKGLGAHENGITEHVIAKYKNDERGLGFEDKNDQWTKHEDDFNALLANLSNASDNTENLHSGVSLEDKSKKSKARIHYHKFTRGKDISRYSEKDLANIFGKKSFKSTEVVEVPVKEDLKTTEQVFTDKGSMADYFKSKLTAFKSKSKFNLQQNDVDDEPSYAFQGFSQEADDVDSCTGFGFGYKSQDLSCNNSDGNSLDCNLENIKKKKKKSKNKDSIEVEEVSDKTEENNHQSEECNGEKINKKKKLKEEIDVPIDPSPVELTNDPDDTNLVKKKKKSKNKDASKYINPSIDATICDNVQELEKSKKKKKKNRENCGDCLVNDNISEENTDVQKKKRKNDEIWDVVENVTEVRKKKKKKKIMELN